MWNAYIKNLLLAVAFLVGILIPQAASAAFLIQYLITVMLLLAFLRMNAPWRKLRKLHFVLLGASVGIALGMWGVLRLAGFPLLAETAFYIGITPTAAAAPVIVGMLDGDAEFTTVAVCVSNLAAALLLPLLLGGIGGTAISMDGCLRALGSVAQVVVVPAVLAVVLRRIGPATRMLAVRCAGGTFYLWLGVLLLAAAKSSQYLHASHSSPGSLAGLAGLSILLCVISFALGRRIGRPDFELESSQALGQKNTTLTIYVSLLYADPLVTLGLTFYVFWHNSWNAYQLHCRAMRKLREQRAAKNKDTIHA